MYYSVQGERKSPTTVGSYAHAKIRKLGPRSQLEVVLITCPRDGQNNWNTCQDPFPSIATQLDNDKCYEIAFLMKSLYRKTLYNIAVKIFAIQAIVSNLCAIVTVAGFQGIPIILSTAKPRLAGTV